MSKHSSASGRVNHRQYSMFHGRRRAILAIAAAAAAAATVPAWANPVSWDKGATTLNWADPANWNPDGLPGSGDQLTFSSTSGGGVIDLGGNRAVDTVAISNGSGTAYTLGAASTANVLTLNSLSVTGSVGPSVNAVLDKGSAGTLTVGTTNGTLTLKGGFADGTSSNYLLTLSASSGKTLTINTLGSARAGSTTVGGGGTVNLNFANAVGSGTVSVSGNTALSLGTASAVSNSVVLSYGTVTYAAGSAVSGGTITANGTASQFGIVNLGANAIGSAALDIRADNTLIVTANSNGVIRGTNLTAAAGAIIGFSSVANSTGGTNNWGTGADLYFGLYNGNLSGSVSIGNGTAWKGLSVADRGSGRSFTTGTLTVTAGTGDIYFRGVSDNGTARVLTLGNGTGTTGGVAISTSGVNANIINSVTLDDNSSDFTNVTFQVTNGATLTLSSASNLTNAVGVTVQSGGVLVASTATSINAPVTVQSGGKFTASQAYSGSGAVTVQSGGVLDATVAGAIGSGESFTFNSGGIVRMSVANITGIGGVSPAAVYESNVTAMTNAETINLNGGTLTNYTATSTLGSTAATPLNITGAATVAATTGTTLTITPAFNAGSNAVTLGSTTSIDSQTKAGTVTFTNGLTAGNLTVSGATTSLTTGSSISGNLTMNGGSLTIAASGVFGAGTIAVNSGTLVAAVASALGSGTDTITIGSGGLLESRADGAVGSHPITVSSGGTMAYSTVSQNPSGTIVTYQSGATLATSVAVGTLDQAKNAFPTSGAMTFNQYNATQTTVAIAGDYSLANDAGLTIGGNLGAFAVSGGTVSNGVTINGTLTGGNANTTFTKSGTGRLVINSASAPTFGDATHGVTIDGGGAGGMLEWDRSVSTAGVPINVTFSAGPIDLKNGGVFYWNPTCASGSAVLAQLTNKIIVESTGGQIRLGLSGNYDMRVGDATNPSSIDLRGMLGYGEIGTQNGGTQPRLAGGITLNGAAAGINIISNNYAKYVYSPITNGTTSTLQLQLSGQNNTNDGYIMTPAASMTYTGGTTILAGLASHNIIVDAGSKLGTGPVTINSGGRLQFNADTNLDASQSTITNNGRLILNYSGTAHFTISGGTLEMAGGGILNLPAGNGIANVVVSAGQLYAPTMADYGASANFSLAGGTFVFDQTSASRKASDFFAAFPTNGTGVNQFQITSNGGLAAKNGNVTISAGTNAFDTSFRLGTSTQTVPGTLDDNGSVTISAPITLSASTDRTWSAAGKVVEGTSTSPIWTITGPVHDIAGQITGGASGRTLNLIGNGQKNSTSSGILRISNSTNSFIANIQIAAADVGSGAVAVFTSDGAFGNSANTVTVTGGARGFAGMLLLQDTTGTGTTFAKAFTISDGDASANRCAFGSLGGAVSYTGTVTLASTNANAPIYVADGTFSLGTPTAAGTIQHNRGATQVVLWKEGPGTFILTNAAYTGPGTGGFKWYLQNGAVRETGTTSATSMKDYAVQTRGGVIEVGFAAGGVNGDFARSLGATAGALDMSGSGGGGFAAYDATAGVTRTIDLGDNATPSSVTWGSGSFVASGSPLILGSATANGTVDFRNPINLNAGSRTIATVRGVGALPEGKISGLISGTGTSNLVLDATGGQTAGSLLLSNAANSYVGTTSVNAGNLLAGADAPSSGAGAFGNASTAVLVGNTTGTQDAGLLTNGAFAIRRNITVRSGSSGTATLGQNAVATGTFSGNITLNKPLTLVAATGGTAQFQTGTWTTNDNPITVGKPGYGGTVRISNPLTTAGGVTVANGTLLADAAISAPVAINAGQLKLMQNQRWASLAITHPTGTLDLGNHAVALNSGTVGVWNSGSSAYTGLTGQIKALDIINSPGIDANHGIGIASGLAAYNNGNSARLFQGTPGDSFVDGDVLIQYGWNGDVNMDGSVTYLDYGVIDNAFLNNAVTGNPAKLGYASGDLNYDGVINYLDYGMMDNAFLAQNAPGAAVAASAALSSSAVPEPAAFGLLAIGALGALVRRRRGR